MLTRYLSLLVFAFSFTTSVHAADMAFELRTYTTNEGKLPALQARFRDHTMRLFEKHGMKNIGYWVPDDKPDTLVYIVAHASREAAAASWRAFVADPEWREVARTSQLDGPILVKDGVVSQFMSPTDYSPIR
ncbi:MAG: NIPSNAP family protein [Proteobacteria bacterium]|nr:NIPSNAP family protein [Pseudomonadota bacterium]